MNIFKNHLYAKALLPPHAIYCCRFGPGADATGAAGNNSEGSKPGGRNITNDRYFKDHCKLFPAICKGREIWGKLVPYGWNVQQFGAGNSAPWRAGANENTTISFRMTRKWRGTMYQPEHTVCSLLLTAITPAK